jgi:hypothetical protein
MLVGFRGERSGLFAAGGSSQTATNGWQHCGSTNTERRGDLRTAEIDTCVDDDPIASNNFVALGVRRRSCPEKARAAQGSDDQPPQQNASVHVELDVIERSDRIS